MVVWPSNRNRLAQESQVSSEWIKWHSKREERDGQDQLEDANARMMETQRTAVEQKAKNYLQENARKNFIEQVEEEQLNDDEFKNGQVLEDIRPISGTARVVLGTLMHQMWVPLIFKAVLYCFSLNEDDHEIHEAFARFSCGKNVNILQM